MKHRDNAKRGKVWTTTEAEMRAYDQLPRPFRDFVKTANEQWACVPMLRRVQKCGRNSYGRADKLLARYQAEDAA